MKRRIEEIADQGISKVMRGVKYSDQKLPGVAVPLPVMVGEKQVGQITSGAWSPRLKRNIGVSMIDRRCWDNGQAVIVIDAQGNEHFGEVANLPLT